VHRPRKQQCTLTSALDAEANAREIRLEAQGFCIM
jgi:hypothetical protein